MLASAMHRTAMPFQAFDCPIWDKFFTKLRGAFKLPSPELIGGEIQIEYTKIMGEVVRHIKQFRMVCMILDGTTNVQGKQVIILMACGPIAFFLEHFTMDLSRESAVNLYANLIDCKRHLLCLIRTVAPGFVVERGLMDLTGENCDSDVDVLEPPAEFNTHFIKERSSSCRPRSCLPNSTLTWTRMSRSSSWISHSGRGG